MRHHGNVVFADDVTVKGMFRAPDAGLISVDAITLAVDGGAGDDTPSVDRPERISGGDYSAFPFLTIQAALNALPKELHHAAIVNVIAAGNYAGFNIRGFHTAEGSLKVAGLQATVTPTTGPATGTATSGSATSLTLTGAGWTADDFVGKFCKIVSGQGAGQHFIIATNTADTLTFAGRMSPVPNATSVFEITEPTTILTSNDSYFYSGIHQSGCVGPSFTVQDFHVEGPSYGVTQVWSYSTLTLARITQKNCYYGFVGQESLKAAWSQIGSLGSTSSGITFLSMGFFGNSAYDKGWLAINTASSDGLYISACKAGGVAGVFTKGCANNGIGVYNSEATINYATADNNLDGLWASGSRVYCYQFSASNNTKRGVGSDFGGRVDLSNTISGTGNGEWGVNAAPGVGGVVTVTSLPTITGTLGDCTVDGTNPLTWATHFSTKDDYASYLPRQVLIVRAA